jgi:hypothetical protein
MPKPSGATKTRKAAQYDFDSPQPCTPAARRLLQRMRRENDRAWARMTLAEARQHERMYAGVAMDETLYWRLVAKNLALLARR